MANKYYVKRNKAGFMRAFVAKEIGLDIKSYRKVEMGLRALVGEKLEKYNKLISDRNNLINQMTLMKKAKNWYVDCDLDEDIKKMGYTRRQVAESLGWSMSKVHAYCHKQSPSNEGIMELYIFLTDEANRNLKPEENEVEEIEEVQEEVEEPQEEIKEEPIEIQEEKPIEVKPTALNSEQPVEMISPSVQQEKPRNYEPANEDTVKFIIDNFIEQIKTLKEEIATKEKEIKTLRIENYAYKKYVNGEI